MSVSQELVDLAIETIINAFFSKLNLKEASEHIVNTLDENDKGYWMCHIYPQEVDNGLVKTQYKGLEMQFARDEVIYVVNVA